MGSSWEPVLFIEIGTTKSLRRCARAFNQKSNFLLIPFTISLITVQRGVSKDKGSYFVHYKDASTALKTKRIDASDQEIFAGQGWHYFLTQNLNRPERIPKSLKLVLPSRLSTYTLQVRRVLETANTVEYHLVFANPIIRLLAPRIEAIYDKRTRKM